MTDLQMPTLHFMPWRRLDREYGVGAIAPIPFSREHPPAGFDAGVSHAVKTILADGIYVHGRPVNQCTLVSLQARLFIEGWDNRAAFETIYDHAQMACLSSLEGRDYLRRAELYRQLGVLRAARAAISPGAAGRGTASQARQDIVGVSRGPPCEFTYPCRPSQRRAHPFFSGPLYHALSDVRSRLLEEDRADNWAAWGCIHILARLGPTLAPQVLGRRV